MATQAGVPTATYLSACVQAALLVAAALPEAADASLLALIEAVCEHPPEVRWVGTKQLLTCCSAVASTFVASCVTGVAMKSPLPEPTTLANYVFPCRMWRGCSATSPTCACCLMQQPRSRGCALLRTWLEAASRLPHGRLQSTCKS